MLQEAVKADESAHQEMPFLDDELQGTPEGIPDTHIVAYGACKAWLLMVYYQCHKGVFPRFPSLLMSFFQFGRL